MKKLEESLQREKLKGIEAQNRVLEVEGKYQPLKEKHHEQENTIRRLGAEKRSLEMQLNHAEAQIKEQKKLQRRESFWVSVFDYYYYYYCSSSSGGGVTSRA